MTAIGNLVALGFPWLVGQLLAITAGYASGIAVMALSVAGTIIIWRRTLGEAVHLS
jgi:DHA1 family inner membrane transport protein